MVKRNDCFIVHDQRLEDRFWDGRMRDWDILFEKCMHLEILDISCRTKQQLHVSASTRMLYQDGQDDEDGLK